MTTGDIFSEISDDNLLIATGYGHTDIPSEVDAISTFRSLGIQDPSKRKVLNANPRACFGTSAATNGRRVPVVGEA